MQTRIFSCKKCGKCCAQSMTARKITLYPEERQILLHEAQMRHLTLKIVPDLILLNILHQQVFMARYALIIPPKAKCPFLQEKRCSIYAHRPLACRAYPLIIKSGYQSPNDLKLAPNCTFIQSLSLNESVALDLGKSRFYGLILGARERAIFLHIQDLVKQQEFEFGTVLSEEMNTWPKSDLMPSP